MTSVSAYDGTGNAAHSPNIPKLEPCRKLLAHCSDHVHVCILSAPANGWMYGVRMYDAM